MVFLSPLADWLEHEWEKKTKNRGPRALGSLVEALDELVHHYEAKLDRDQKKQVSTGTAAKALPSLLQSQRRSFGETLGQRGAARAEEPKRRSLGDVPTHVAVAAARNGALRVATGRDDTDVTTMGMDKYPKAKADVRAVEGGVVASLEVLESEKKTHRRSSKEMLEDLMKKRRSREEKPGEEEEKDDTIGALPGPGARSRAGSACKVIPEAHAAKAKADDFGTPNTLEEVNEGGPIWDHYTRTPHAPPTRSPLPTLRWLGAWGLVPATGPAAGPAFATSST
ncbi:cyclic nucleotide-gated ion channel [Aureococcus anophagefferens]|nr:cyclic nucleotide-gated ion channel [Aureococcus anophagefferens]